MAHDGSDAANSRNALTGTITGSTVQAGSIRDVHFHGIPAQHVAAPRQLPAAPSHFTGRAVELARLDGLLDADVAGLAIVTGTAGVGKSALGVEWAHRVRDVFTDGQLYADLGGYGGGMPADPGGVLGMFLRALGVPPQGVPATLAEQVSMYRSVTASRSLLVMLDNALSSAQVRVLRPSSASSRVVVTSRGRLDGLVAEGALLIDVGPFDVADSVALLTRTLGASRFADDHDSAEALADFCGGLPVALRVAAGRLVTRPRLSLRRMVTELADEETRLSRLSTMDGLSVSTVFDASYRSLDPIAARLYRRLALHPGPEFGLGPAAAALRPSVDSEPTHGDIGEVADLLAAASLLQEIGEERFRFHDLLRLHARQKVEADESPPDRDAALLAILEWYWSAAVRADRIVTPHRRRLPYRPATEPLRLPVPTGRETALAWLERERVNLVAAARQAMAQGYHELAWQLCDVLWPLLLVRKSADRMDVDRLGLAAAQAWGNTWAEADMRKRLGRICTTTGRFDEAEQQALASIRLYRETDDAQGVVDAQETLAALYRDSGRQQQAVDLFQRTLATRRKLGNDRSTGLTLISLGRSLSALDRPDEALPLLLEAGEILDRLVEPDPYNRVRVTIALAGAYCRLGDLADAEAAATEAARRMGELGSAFERAEALDLLGQIAQRRGDADVARRHFSAALDIFAALGSMRAAQVRAELVELDTD